jgi:WD40 repeat protein
LWEVVSGEEVRQFTGHTGAVRAFVISPDGRYALSASNDDTLRLWEMTTGWEARVFAGHSTVLSCAFSPDGRYALSASWDALRLWDVASGKEVRVFVVASHTYMLRGWAFSPDGRYALSAANDDTLRLWEVISGAQRAVWHGEAEVFCCAFSPLGDRALAGDSEGGVHLFRIVGLGRDEADAAQTAAAPAPYGE